MDSTRIRPRRSLIFAPGNKPEMFPTALKTDADIVTVDLEDAVAPNYKDDARAKTMALFESAQPDDGVECVVRINCLRTPEGLRDVLAILNSETPPPALMLTKVKTPDEVRLLDELLTGSHGHIRFHVIIETNDGLGDGDHAVHRTQDRFLNQLSVYHDEAAVACLEGVDDAPRPIKIFGTWAEHRVDDGDLLGMDRGLTGEAERRAGLRLGLKTGLVLEIEKRHIDQVDICTSGRMNET